jgi:hypothetical protein
MDSTQPKKPMKPTQPSQLTQTDAQTERTQPAELSELSTTGRQLVAESKNKLKRIITTHPARALPQRGNDDFMVRTDASDYALGGTLRQMQAGKENILAYFSRKLHAAETRYATYDKELLTIRNCLKHWRHYLLWGGRKVQVTTDHSSIQHILTQPRLTPRKMRALQDIIENDVKVKYLPGAKNYVQDALSRRPDYQEPPLPRATVSRRERETRKKAEMARAGDMAGTEVPGKVSGKASREVWVREDTGEAAEEVSGEVSGQVA